ncbi:M23 family metallopeptidase [Muricauda sp. 2012CJ35-5]|uniref:M23 family metallopeptidase n=1 Tax=Flagellimonas spongiicola TaxID=2942208 RepID=A0ABT0PTN4_9FLAO|nr:M23 family metallopeptidase [Allomuricauda spongiicola]MCL6274758.1 M23 family metallopeptidase [Allomuricauda spongiicola]
MKTNKLISKSLVLLAFLSTNCHEEKLAPSGELDYLTTTSLQLPFAEEWYVVWGGRTLAENYHASISNQRFAIDVVQFENGSTFLGDGSKNEDYHCFGKPLEAPADGQVVALLNSVADNKPGETNKNELFGNYIIIDHGNDEFSVLAHFKQNSISVNIGEFVNQGDNLGQTGNSGNSTEPHLHYHLQNKPSIGQGEGLPAQFRNYYADNVFEVLGEPRQNETVRKG